MNWKILARNRWVAGATITESVNKNDGERRFTATVRGYRNWHIYQGTAQPETLQLIIRVVRAIRDQIDAHGEDAEAFAVINDYCQNVSELERRAEIFESPLSKLLEEFLVEEEAIR